MFISWLRKRKREFTEFRRSVARYREAKRAPPRTSAHESYNVLGVNQFRNLKDFKESVLGGLCPPRGRNMRAITLMKKIEGLQCLYWDEKTRRFCKALIERKRRDDRGYSAEYFGHVRVRQAGNPEDDGTPPENEGKEEAEPKVLTEVPMPSHYGVSIIYNRPSLLPPPVPKADVVFHDFTVDTPKLGVGVRARGHRIVVTEAPEKPTLVGCWLHAINGTVLRTGMNVEELAEKLKELLRPLKMTVGKQVWVVAKSARPELVDKICRITDRKLFFMRMKEQRNVDSASWLWREINSLTGLDPHEKMDLESLSDREDEDLEFLRYDYHICEHPGQKGRIIDPWSRIPEGYVKEEALRVGGEVDEVNFEPEDKGIPIQTRPSLQDDNYVMEDGKDYSALKLSDEELDLVASLMKTVGRGNKASDLGLGYQQHVGPEETMTFEGLRKVVDQGGLKRLSKVGKLKPPVGSDYAESNVGIRLPGLTGVSETIGLFRAVPKLFGLFLLAQKRAGEAQDKIDADERIKQKRPSDIKADHPARTLHKQRLEVLYEALYAELRGQLLEIGVPEIKLEKGWMKFDAITAVLSNRDANVFPHFDRLNSVKKPWVSLEIAQVEVKGESAGEIPPITFCPPNRSCPASEYVIVDATKSYSVPDLNRILHFARPNIKPKVRVSKNLKLEKEKVESNMSGPEDTGYCRLAFVFYHKGWIETAEHQRKGKEEKQKKA